MPFNHVMTVGMDEGNCMSLFFFLTSSLHGFWESSRSVYVYGNVKDLGVEGFYAVFERKSLITVCNLLLMD